MATPRLHTLLSLAMCVVGAAGGCGPVEDAGADAAPGSVSVLTVGATPSLEIGVLEGDADFSFHDVVGTLHLPSGNVAVADAGSEQISIFTSDGTFVRRVARQGEGPGELRDLVGLHPTGSDSVLAADARTGMLLVFDSSGAYARQFPAVELSRDSIFPLDSWLHGRFWVQGALAESARVSVRAALDALPQPLDGPGFRIVLVAEDGRLWIREPDTSASGTRSWTIVEPSGRPASMIELPGQLDPLEIRSDAVTGRWLGESDVNFVRSYPISSAEETRPLPAWLTAAPSTSTEPAPAQDEFLQLVRGAIRQMASAQEIHYASHMTYTTETDSLTWERPEGIEVTFVKGNARAWAAVFTHPALDRICALAYGFDIPAGWQPGRVLCSPAAP